MKKYIFLLLILVFSSCLTACGSDSPEIDTQINISNEDDSPEVSPTPIAEETETETTQQKTDDKIIMPYSSSYYESSDWTSKSLMDHFIELGFKNVLLDTNDPNEEYNMYDIIYSVTISTGIFSESSWEQGEALSSDKIIRIYYNDDYILTVDNCPELLLALTTDLIPYNLLANKYDGRLVEFNGFIYEHITYTGGIDHIIDVKGGNFEDSETNEGIIIRVGDRKSSDRYNYGATGVGDEVTVRGRIDASWSDYYDQLYVETFYLDYRT